MYTSTVSSSSSLPTLVMKTISSTTASIIVARQAPHKSLGSATKKPLATRKPLGQIFPQNPSISEKLEEASWTDVDAWYASIARANSISTTDHKSEYIASVRDGIDTITRLEKIRPDLSLECNALLRVLRDAIKAVDASYSNEMWLMTSPPISLAQTLRRTKNWAQNVIRSPVSDSISHTQLKEFTRKLQESVKSIPASA